MSSKKSSAWIETSSGDTVTYHYEVLIAILFQSKFMWLLSTRVKLLNSNTYGERALSGEFGL